MAGPHDLVDGGHEFVPGAALGLQKFAARGRQPVTTAAALARLFEPAAGDQAAVFQAEQDGVERSDAKADLAFGALLDEFADVVAVARARLPAA